MGRALIRKAMNVAGAVGSRVRSFAGSTAGKVALGGLAVGATVGAVALGRKIFGQRKTKRSSISRLRAQVMRNTLKIQKLRSERRLRKEQMKV